MLKLLANRHCRLIDVIDVLLVQDELDRAYITHWAGQIKIDHRLQQTLDAC